MHFLPRLAFTALVSCLPLTAAFAWSEPHHAITRAAVEVLPPWERDWLGAEAAPLGDSYCLIPDKVFTDRANAPFAAMESRPGERYLLNLHLPAQQPENLETMRYFMGKAVAALRSGDVASAARFMGTVCHQIEDYGSPAHTVPGDNMFTLLQQFLPAPDAMKDQLLHSPIESGELKVGIPGYAPRLLGTSVEEASWRLMHRVHEEILNARRTTVPIIQALYAADAEKVKAEQLKAATVDAQVVADALHTILALGAERFDADAAEALDRVEIGSFFPLEAESLYFAQKQFFSSPHWGHARSGVVLAEGKHAQPLRLRVEGKPEPIEFANGISAGMGKPLTFLLPPGVYKRFTVRAGLHPELGEKGKVEFAVSGDGKPLGSVIVSGTEPARELTFDVSEVSQLQLSLTPRNAEPKSQYAIWGEPVLWKK